MASLVNEEAKGHGNWGYTASCPAKWNSKPGSPARNPGHFTHLLLCLPESSSLVPHRSCERRQCYQFRLMQRLCPRSLGKEVELGFKFSLACFQGLCSSHYTKWFLLRSLSLSWSPKSHTVISLQWSWCILWHLYLVTYFPDDISYGWGLALGKFPQCFWQNKWLRYVLAFRLP